MNESVCNGRRGMSVNNTIIIIMIKSVRLHVERRQWNNTILILINESVRMLWVGVSKQ